MRSFPSAEGLIFPLRSRLNARRLHVLLALAIASVLFVAPTATADDDDDLERRQQKVQRQVKNAKGDLHRSSKKVQRLNGALARAESRLSDARSRLADVRSQLQSARAESERVAAQLRRAEQRLDRVIGQLEKARLKVRRQEGTVRGTVTEMAREGDPRLEALTSMLGSGSLEEMMINRTAGELVVNTQFQSLVDLEAAEAAVAARKRQVEQVRDEVAVKKREADRLVRRKRGLVGEAETVEKKVRTLVDTTAQRRQQAQAARSRDQAALRKLEQREEAIRRKILAARAADGNFNGNSDGFLHYPANGPISSPYGYRTHPIYGYRGLHDGVDFAADCGSPLYAGSGGRVTHAYYDDVYGYRLYLDIGRVNGDRITLVYNHMSGIQAGSGQTFGRGQVLGRVGTTGWSTGCHLHFTVLRNGNPVDPMIYL